MPTDRILFVSPMLMSVDNGMLQRQHQWLVSLNGFAPGKVDLLSLGDSAESAKIWIKKNALDIDVITGWYPALARLNSAAWYAAGAVLCSKLGVIESYRFPVTTPLPRSLLNRYEMIICYYAWNHRLLSLASFGSRVIVDLGDVMADRHERTGSRRWISLTADDERDVIAGGARCLAISDDDAREFARLYGVALPIVPFVPPDAESLMAVQAVSSSRDIGFFGAPSYLNEQILEVFATDEFASGLSRLGCRLVVAGGICGSIGASLRSRLQRHGVALIGKITHKSEFFNRVRMLLNPVGPSSGVKIKSVETLVAGRGLVTTQWGADRVLNEFFGKQVRLIDWPIDCRSMLEACDELMSVDVDSARDRARRYVENGRAIMQQHLLR